MEDRSNKHSPRVDDAIEHDTRGLFQGSPVEPRADGGREKEDLGEVAPPATGVRADRAPFDERLTYDEVEARSLLARHLQPSVFPARPGELVESARREFAPDGVIAWLEQLPEGQYENVESVWEALGGRVEYRA